MQIINVQKIGKNVLDGISHAVGSMQLFYDCLSNISTLFKPSIRTILYKQIYFTGVKPLVRVAIIGLLIGIVIITQVNSIVGLNAILIGKLLVWTVVREFGPIVIAILVIARSCTAMTSELGSMMVKREVDSLRIMGIKPLEYLIIPRIIGTALSMFVLTFYFQVVSIAGGLAVSSLLTDIPFLKNLKDISLTLDLFDIGVSLFKSAVFGLLISTVSCYHGLKVRQSITRIPQATILAVMQSIFYIFIFDGIFAVTFFV